MVFHTEKTYMEMCQNHRQKMLFAYSHKQQMACFYKEEVNRINIYTSQFCDARRKS